MTNRESIERALDSVFPWLRWLKYQEDYGGENLLQAAVDLALAYYQEEFVARGEERGAFLIESEGHLAWLLADMGGGWRAIGVGSAIAIPTGEEP